MASTKLTGLFSGWPAINLFNLCQRLLRGEVPWKKKAPILCPKEMRLLVWSGSKKKPKNQQLCSAAGDQQVWKKKILQDWSCKILQAAKDQQWNLFLFLPTVKKSDHKQYKDSKLLSRELGMPVTQTTERRKSSNISWEEGSHASQCKT